MKKISSGLTLVTKKIFPVFWFGFLAIFFVMSVVSGAAHRDAMFVLVPVLVAAVGYVLMKKFVLVLVDEVYDCGDFLLVRNRGEEDRILLTNVMNVTPSTFMNPPQITLRLASPGKWGTEVVFSPIRSFTLIPFARNAIAEDVIVRVDRARRSAAR